MNNDLLEHASELNRAGAPFVLAMVVRAEKPTSAKPGACAIITGLGAESDMKVRDVIKALEQDGWQHVRTTGSHRHFQHPSKPGTVTVPGHPNDDIHPKTLASVWKQAGLAK